VFGSRVYNELNNKLFFFFSHEFRRVITSSNFIATAPTAGERQGIFSVPVCIAGTGTTCTQVLQPGTPIPNINPVAAAYINDIYSKIPLPSAGTNTLNTATRSVFNYRQELLRLDYNFSERLNFAVRFLNDTIPTEEPGGLFTNNQLPGVATTKTDSPGRSWFLRSVQTIRPTLYNEIGFAYSYGAIISRTTGLNRRVNSPNINPILPFTPTLDRVPNINPGYTGVTGFGPYDDFNRNYNVYDNVTKTLGKQTLKFGVSFHYYQKTENAAGNNVGTFNFSTTPRASFTDPVSGQTVQTPVATQQWAYFLLGRASSFTQDSRDFTPDVRSKQLEFYFQDDYRLRPNLTVNFGVRYSLFRQPFDASGNLSNFNPRYYDPTRAFQIDANGNRVPGTGDPLNGIIIGGRNSRFGDKVAPENNGNFAPVFGFAWDPFRDGRTAVRGGYGISYDTTLFGIVEQNIFTNPPLVSSVNISNPSLDNPGASAPNVSAALNLRGIPFDTNTPYVQQWSLDAQREVLKGLIVDVGYFGSKGTHLLGIVDLNQVPPGAAVAAGLIGPTEQVTASTVAKLNAVRPYKGYVAINAPQNWFNSNYHSLQVAVEKRFVGGSLIKAAYTWSHNMTDNQSDRGAAPQSLYNFKADYGPAAFDRRHILTVNYVYDLPFFRQQEGVTGRLLGGWQVSGITTYAAGVPLTVTTTGVDPSALGFTSSSTSLARPDMIADPNRNAPRTFAQWFSTSAFAEVPAGVTRPGTSGRGVVLGPGYGRWDLALARNIKINEDIRFQLRAETFNIFNHTNPLTVNTVRTNALFGQITNTRDPRLIQLGLKLYF
ncbi:MAG: adenylyl cyclase, partial [Blastocatellia bacterium]